VAAAEDPRQESSCLEIWIGREKPIQERGTGKQEAGKQGGKAERSSFSDVFWSKSKLSFRGFFSMSSSPGVKDIEKPERRFQT
jgi:hypothetical protein